jgi:hypothetical protein
MGALHPVCNSNGLAFQGFILSGHSSSCGQATDCFDLVLSLTAKPLSHIRHNKADTVYCFRLTATLYSP